MIVLGIFNILTGLFILLVLLSIQGIGLFAIGIPHIIFGSLLLGKKISPKLFFAGIIPTSIFFSSILILAVIVTISGNMPKGFETPPLVGLIIIFPVLLVGVVDILFLKRSRIK